MLYPPLSVCYVAFVRSGEILKLEFDSVSSTEVSVRILAGYLVNKSQIN